MITVFLLLINNSNLSSKANRLDTKWPQVWINLTFKLCHQRVISIIVSSNNNNLQLSNSNNNSHSSNNSSNRIRALETIRWRLAVIIVPLMLLPATIPAWQMSSLSKAEGHDQRTCPSHRHLKICKCASNSLTWRPRRMQIWKRN